MSAVENIITDNLPIWSSSFQSKSSSGRGTSSKRTLYGVKKLRELILDLAVRGLLVPQDPKDESASVLLGKIAAEKEQLIKEGKIKKQKELQSVSIDKITFPVPLNWEPERFGNVYTMEYGNGLKQSARSNTGEFPVYGSNGIVGTHKDACISEPCIVIGRKGSAGALNLCRNRGCWVTDVAYSIVPPVSLNLDFVFIQLQTLGLDKLGKGIKPGLNRNEAYSLELYFPPLAEQHRIVAKVDELMALCDTLEQQQEDSIQAHETLVEALLEALTDAIDADASQTAWQRISEHFDVLFTTEHSIDKLKETILQLAVMGKLIPQDPKDEKISAQIDKAVQYKSEIAELKKIRADKEKYLACARFVEPTNWCWLCLGDFMHVLGGKRVPAGYKLLNDKTDHVYLRVTDMKNHSITQDDLKYIEPKIYESIKRYVISADDIYITIAGTIGYVGAVPDNLDGANLTENAAKLVFGEMDKNFLIYVLSSIYVQRQFQHAVNQMAQPKLSLVSIKGTSVALPPLAEQHRIVAKVDELMAISDKLKDSLQQAQQTQIHLTDAVVENAL